MITRTLLAGTTSASVVLRIIDSTDGTPETGVVAATTGLALKYRRELGADTALTAASDLAALTTAFAAGGLKHIADGYYRVDVDNAAFAAGVSGVLVHGAATNMIVIGCYVELVAYDPYTTPGTAPTNFNLMVIDSNGRIDLSKWLGSTVNALQSGRVDAYVGALASGVIAAATFAANALDAVWSTATRLLTAGTNIVLAKGTGVTGFNDLDAAAVRTAIGLTAANLENMLGYKAAGTFAACTTTTFAVASGDKAKLVAGDLIIVIPASGAKDASYADSTYDASTGSGGWDPALITPATLGATATYIALSAARAPTTSVPTVALTSSERTTLVSAVWDKATSALTTVGSIGKRLADDIDTVLSTLATSSAVSTVSTNVSSVLSRLGSFTGSGLNTVLGFLRAIMRKDASLTPTDVGGTFDNTTDSQEAVKDNILTTSLSNLATPAQVNAEVVDALATDTYAEPASVPAATASLKDKIGYLFLKARNKITQTSTTQLVRNDGDSATVATSTVSDDGTTFTKGKDA